MADEQETARILKESLKIIDELGKIDSDEIIIQTNKVITYTDNYDKIIALIDRAKRLRKNKLFILK